MRTDLFWKPSVIFVGLAVLQITKHASAQNTTVSSSTTTSPSSTSTPSSPSSTSSPQPPVAAPSPSQSYLTVPANFTVGLGDPAHFWCGVPKSSEGLVFTLYGNPRNYTLSCPNGDIEDIPQALQGLCIEHSDELLAAWVLKGTSIPDNGTRVVCQRQGHPAAPAAFLHVYDNGSGNGLLIGLGVGVFFGVLAVCGLLYLTMTKSERLQMCFRGKQPDDLTEIMDDIQPTARSNPTATSQSSLNMKMKDLD